jgi:plastocyanin
MRRLPIAARPFAAAIAVSMAAAPAASADERIEAGPPQQYTTKTVTMDQGERLTFRNLDTDVHDVTAKDKLQGKPLFSTPIIDTGSEVFVDDSQYLTTGSYDFFCSVHPFMTGTLKVSSAGTPVPRPPGPRPSHDRTAPSVKLKLAKSRISRLRRKRKLSVKVTVNEAATIKLTATTLKSGRKVTLGKKTVKFTGARSRNVKIKLTRKGRRALKAGRKARVTVTASAEDKTGNVGEKRASRSFKP